MFIYKKDYEGLNIDERREVHAEYEVSIKESLQKIIRGISLIILIIQLFFIVIGDRFLFSGHSNEIIQIRLFFIAISILTLLGSLKGIDSNRITMFFLLAMSAGTAYILGITGNRSNIVILWLFMIMFNCGFLPISLKRSIFFAVLQIPLYLFFTFYFQGFENIPKKMALLIFVFTFGPISLVFKYIFLGLIERQFVNKRIIQKMTEKKVKEESSVRLKKDKDDFLSITAHELRTPLNGILGLLDSNLKGDVIDRNELFIAFSATKRLSFLVDDIINNSKLEYGDVKIEKRSLRIGPVIEFARQLLLPLIGEKKLTIEIEEFDKELEVVGDENRILQILYNIIGNSIKFSNKGKVIISVVEDGELVKIAVKDQGIGIPEDKLGNIFKKFNEVNSDSPLKGTGIGLYISKKLVELQGGSLEAFSDLGRGTVLTINFRRSHQLDRSYSPNKLNHFFIDSKPATYVEGNKKLIYIVDDDHFNIRAFQSSLSNIYCIKTFISGEDLLGSLERETPDLIILDLVLPGLNGVETLKKIRDKHDELELPVIIITASSKEGELDQCLLAGANEFLNKPILRDELRARVKNILHLRDSYKKNIESEHILTIIESLVEITVSSTIPDNSSSLPLDTERLCSVINSLEGRKFDSYKERLERVKNNLTPYLDNKSIVNLVDIISKQPTVKESYSSFISKYKLSKNQAELLRHVFNGEVTHDGLAEITGKTKSNISSTLNRIYNKVGVSNQAELMLNIDNVYLD